MMRKIKFIVIVLIIVWLQSCNNTPTSVGFSSSKTKGYIRGTVVDSTSKRPLENVDVFISEIVSGSEFIDTATTNSDGKFEIEFLHEKNYYLSFRSIGYKCKNIFVSVKDTLDISNEINLERNKYPYEIVPIQEMPTDSTKQGFYYKLDPSVYYQEFFTNWHIAYNASASYVSNIKAKVDSVIINLLRNNIKPDTLWYKFYQGSCGAAMVSFEPELVIKLKEENTKVAEFDFVEYDFKILPNEGCIDSTETIIRNSFFDL